MTSANLIDSEFAMRLTTTFLHFLWQGTVVAWLAALVSQFLLWASAHARYTVHVSALIIILCLRRSASELVDRELVDRIRVQAMGMRGVPLLRWSAEISVPVVIGIMRPLILLPAGAATGLSIDQLEAVIAHELAHIRRYDLMVNMLQRVIEALLFFHPAVWWVSRQISKEREQACDDFVLSGGFARTQYADALVRMAEVSCNQRGRRAAMPATALAADGAAPTEFKRRILKVLGASPTSDRRPGRWSMFFAVACILLATAAPGIWFQLSKTAAAQPAEGTEFDGAMAYLRSLHPDSKVADPAAKGRELAEADIAAGKRHILHYGEPWSAGKPLRIVKPDPDEDQRASLLRMLKPDGTPADRQHSLVMAFRGYQDAVHQSRTYSLDEEGNAALALPPGEHVLAYATGWERRQLLRVKIGKDGSIQPEELKLREHATYTGRAISVQAAPSLAISGSQLIDVTIHNETTEMLSLSERDITITTPDLRVFHPFELAVGDTTLPTLEIRSGEAKTVRLDWFKWIRNGYWVPRTEDIDEAWPPFIGPEANIQIRVNLGNIGSNVVQVTHPRQVNSVSTALRFSEPSEVVVSIGTLKFMLDLDTGETTDLPQIQRPEQNRMDVRPKQWQPYEKPELMNGLDLIGVKVPFANWNASVGEFRETMASDRVQPLKEMAFDPDHTATYFFTTREGTNGILQLIGRERVTDAVNEPWGVRLRYKTLRRVALLPLEDSIVGATNADEAHPVFGDTKNGLQLGIERRNAPRPVSAGDWVVLDTYIRNVSDKRIAFRYLPPHAVGRVPRVTDTDGQDVAIQGRVVSYETAPQRVFLEPGEAWYHAEGLQAGPRPDGKELGPFWKGPRPGKYTVDLSIDVEIIGADAEAPGAQLTSGEVDFEFAEKPANARLNTAAGQPDIKVGMTFDEVIRIKGKHYRPYIGMGRGQLFLTYDDITVGVENHPYGPGQGRVWRIDQTPPDVNEFVGNTPYADAVRENALSPSDEPERNSPTVPPQSVETSPSPLTSGPTVPAPGQTLSSDSEGTAEETAPQERTITLSVKNKPVSEVLANIARQAGLTLELDTDALAATDWDSDRLVTLNLDEAPFAESVAELVADTGGFPIVISSGVCWTISREKLLVTTLESLWARRAERIQAMGLPEWLWKNESGIGGDVHDDGSLEISVHRAENAPDRFAEIAALPRVTKLHLDLSVKVSDEALQVLSKLEDLQQLELTHAGPPHFRPGRADLVLSIIKDLPNLRELSLHETGASDAGFAHLADNKSLESLSVYQDGGVGNAAIEVIASWEQLKSLSLTQYVFIEGFPRMAYSAESLRKLSALANLTQLSLIGFDVPPEAIELSRLKTLRVSGRSINDEAAVRIARCAGLRSLTLSDTQVGDEGLRTIAESTELHYLSLIRNTEITDVGISHLQRLPLRQTEIRGNSLSDKSFEHLAQIKTLRRIDINGSGRSGQPRGPAEAERTLSLTIDGMRAFKDLPHLRTLWITGFPSDANYAVLAELKQLHELTFSMALTELHDLEFLERALPNTNIMAGTGGGWVGGFGRERKRAQSDIPPESKEPDAQPDLPEPDEPAGEATSEEASPSEEGAPEIEAPPTVSSEPPIATVLDQPVTLSMITYKSISAADVEAKRGELSAEDFQTWLYESQSLNLVNRVSRIVMKDYREHVELRPTREEIAAELSAFVKRHPNMLDEEHQQETGIGVGWTIGSSMDWVLAKHLHEAYGGRLAISSFGAYTAMDGRNAVLKKYADAGKIMFHDREYESMFWKRTEDPAVLDVTISDQERIERRLATGPWQRWIVQTEMKLTEQLKVGMSREEVVSIKGRHYRQLDDGPAGEHLLVYDDVGVCMEPDPANDGDRRVTRFYTKDLAQFADQFPDRIQDVPYADAEPMVDDSDS